MKKLGGSQNFFMRNRGVTKKNQEIFEWLQILMKTLFNEIAPQMHIFCATRIGGYMFLQHCSSGGGVIEFLIIKWGVTKYCRGTSGNS